MRKNKQHKPLVIPKRYKVGFLEKLDNRSHSYKMLSAAYEEIMEDVDAGSLTHTRTVLIERFVFMEFLIRSLEYRFIKHPKKMMNQVHNFIRMTDSLARLSKIIGLKRPTKKVTSLSTYIGDKE